jgi:hypothetical protein
MIDQTMRDTYLYLVVYNITNKSTLNEARDYLNRILHVREWDKSLFVSEYKWLGTYEGIKSLHDTEQIWRSNLIHTKEGRSDYNNNNNFGWNTQHAYMLPAILVGNKLDLALEHREVWYGYYYVSCHTHSYICTYVYPPLSVSVNIIIIMVMTNMHAYLILTILNISIYINIYLCISYDNVCMYV